MYLRDKKKKPWKGKVERYGVYVTYTCIFYIFHGVQLQRLYNSSFGRYGSAHALLVRHCAQEHTNETKFMQYITSANVDRIARRLQRIKRIMPLVKRYVLLTLLLLSVHDLDETISAPSFDYHTYCNGATVHLTICEVS